MPHDHRRGLGAIIPRVIARLPAMGGAGCVRGSRDVVASVDACVVSTSPSASLLETRVRRRWDRATTVGAQTATRALGRSFVRVDGWLTEEWLARRATPRGEDRKRRAITREEARPVEPTLSAASLLALRTQVVATGACDR